MSVTIIKWLIELMRRTVMNLVIQYSYIVLLYEIESQLYAMKFAQVKKFFFVSGRVYIIVKDDHIILYSCIHIYYIPVFLFGLTDCLLWS